MPTKHILVIDDEAQMCRSITAALKTAGFASTCAASLQDGLRLLEDDPPDLLICDVYLGDGNGLDALGRIRSHSQTAHLPLIMITGNYDSETMRRGMDLGADDFLIKPFSARQLIATVHSRLDRTTATPTPPSITTEHLHKLLDHSPLLIGLSDAAMTQFSFINRTGRDLIGLGSECEPRNIEIPAVFTDPRGNRLTPPAGSTVPWTTEALLHTCAGSTLPVRLTITPHAHLDGSVEHLSIVAHDLSAEREAGRARCESEALLRSVMDNVAEAICVLDGSGRAIWTNAAFARLLTIIGARHKPEFCVDLVHPNDRIIASDALERARTTGASGTFSFRVPNADGTLRQFSARLTRIEGDPARTPRLIAIVQDATEDDGHLQQAAPTALATTPSSVI